MIRTAYRYVSYLPAGASKQSLAVLWKCSNSYINRREHYSLCNCLKNRSVLDSITPVGYSGVGGKRQFNTRDILEGEKHLSDSALVSI